MINEATNWFWSAFLVKLGLFSGSVAVTVATVVCVVVAYALFSLPSAIKQMRCKHEHIFEDGLNCDAICRDCGKNLGFIGTWRERSTPKIRARSEQEGK